MPKTVSAYKLAEAKAKLGQLCDQALRGRSARIVRGGELFELVHVKRPEVVPANEAELRACYADPDDVHLVNRFGQESL